MTLSLPPEPLTVRQRTAVVWLAVFCALTRLLARAKSLWDWDESLFVLAMRDYDVTLHHPHPPGFPLFVGAANLLRTVTGDDFRALQALSLAAAALVFPAVFLFARELRFRFETAAGAALLFAFLPNVWFFGGTGFSDVPSIVLVLFAVTLLLRGVRSRNAYWGGTLLLALAIGVRPQNFLVGLVPGILATRKRRPLEIALAFLGGLAVVASAYGGAIAATGSFDDYLRVVREHGDYISRVDSWRSPLRPALWRISDRFFAKQYQSPVFSFAASLLVIVSMAGSIRERSRPMLRNVLTFGPFALFAWLMLDRFSVSRFSIGYQPMFAILAADGIRRTAAWVAARTNTNAFRAELALLAIVAGGFAAYTYPALRPVRQEVAPSVLAAQEVNRRVDPSRESLFVGHSVSKFVDLFAPDVPYTRVIDDRALPLSEPASAWILAEITSTPVEGLVFRRERGHLWNIARRHYFEIKLAPLRRRATFLSGWYPAEKEGIHEWRWMRRRSVTLLPAVSGVAKLRMHFALPEETASGRPVVTVKVNGRVIDEFPAGGMYVDRDYDVTPAAGGAPNTLELSVDRGVVRSGEPDEVALRLRYLAWGPS